MTGLEVAVIGAGIGGLSAAVALRSVGATVHVYEQAHKLGEVGAGISLQPNATRDWLRQTFLELAADTGVADSQALADALTVLYDGALATAEMDSVARAAAMTAKRIARLTLAAAKASSST